MSAAIPPYPLSLHGMHRDNFTFTFSNRCQSTNLEYKCLFDKSTSEDFTVSYHFTIKVPVTNHKPSILAIVFGGSLDYLAFVSFLVLV